MILSRTGSIIFVSSRINKKTEIYVYLKFLVKVVFNITSNILILLNLEKFSMIAFF